MSTPDALEAAPAANTPAPNSEEHSAARALTNIGKRTPDTAGKKKRALSKRKEKELCDWVRSVEDAGKKTNGIPQLVDFIAALAHQLFQTSIEPPDGGFKKVIKALGLRTSPMLQPHYELSHLLLTALKVLSAICTRLKETQVGHQLSQEDQRCILNLLRAIETIYAKSHISGNGTRRFFHAQRNGFLLPGSMLSLLLNRAMICSVEFNLSLYDILVIQCHPNKKNADAFLKDYWQKTTAKERRLNDIFSGIGPILAPEVITIDGDESKDAQKKETITVVVSQNRPVVLGCPNNLNVRVVML